MQDDDELEWPYLAEDRASVYAPKPQYDPADAGQMGLLCIVLAFIVFSGLANVDLETLAVPLVICAAIGFGLPYLYFAKLRRDYFKAWTVEYEKLRTEFSEPE